MDCNFAYPLDFDLDQAKSFIATHALAMKCRWWKARLDTTYNDQTGARQTSQNKDQWLRTEQDGEYIAIVRGSTAVRRYFPAGDIKDEDILLVFDPNLFPLGDHDFVMPYADAHNDCVPEGRPTTTLLDEKELHVRGEVETLQAGLLTSSGTAVTGVNTAFSTTLQAGDLIKAAGQPIRISSVSGNTSLTLASAPSPAWSANQFYKASEAAKVTPVASILAIETNSTTYIEGVDFTLSADEASIQWLTSNQPAAGDRYALHYSYYPKYVVNRELGFRRRPIGGQYLLQSVVARLYRYDARVRG